MRRLGLPTWLFLLAFLGLLPNGTVAPMETDRQPLHMQGTGAVPLPAEIEAALPEGINLPTLIRLAVERNPQLKAARARWQATIEKYPQVTTLPDPMFMYGYFLRSVETRVGPQRH